MNCPRCGNSLQNSTAKFCPQCGQNLAQFTRVCPQCQTSARPNARFCAKCRHDFARNPHQGAQRVCPHCARSNRPQAAHCIHCGLSLTAQRITHPYETGRLPSKALLNSRYLIISLLAQGGMSALYQGFDTRAHNMKCAIKEMSYMHLSAQVHDQLRDNFRREFEILYNATHPNLPRVFDFFEEQNRPYIVMELIEGSTLESLWSNRASMFLPQDRVLAWARQLCDVLDYLHSQTPPIIYRDLKPSNVMEMNNTTNIKLIDFGIARFHKPGKQGDTMRFGTDGYLAPEIAGSMGQTSARTDMYALGVVLHQLLTNYDILSTPFQFPKASSLNPSISPEVEKAIEKAVQVKPDLRIQTAEEMLQALFGAKEKIGWRLTTATMPPPPKAQRPLPPLPPVATPTMPPSALPSPPLPKPQHPLPPLPPVAAPTPQIILNMSPLTLRLAPAGAGQLQITAAKKVWVSVSASADWLKVSPEVFEGNDGVTVITANVIDQHLTVGDWSPAPNLFKPLAWWLSVHASHLVPQARAHTAQVMARASGCAPCASNVEVVVRPPQWRVVVGWGVVSLLLVLEAGLLLSPIIYFAGQLLWR
jgi:serine/threonine-protein kinase